MNKLITRLLLTHFLMLAVLCSKAQIFPYKNPEYPIEMRVKDLLSRMTPEEKFWQCFMIPGDLNDTVPGQFRQGIFGLQVSASAKGNGNTQQMLSYNLNEEAAALAKKINSIQQFFVEKNRLGIPIIAFDEALHGLVRKGATAFPQSIAMAATFDTALMGKVSRAVAEETKQRGIRQVLSPVINIATDVRWGRTEETYGEDPYLSSMMGLAYIQAFEEKGIITTPKHFLANVGDGGRDSYPIDANERLLKEIHLPPFKTAILQGGAGSVMTSYNALNGRPATANKWLLEDLLKKEYGFQGFVISDASAVGGANVLHYTATDYADASQQSMQNGLDVIFQTDYNHHKLFIPPFLNNGISQSRIDDAVSRILTAKFKLGLFENPYIKIDTANDLAAHRKLAKEAAEKSFVLLQNNGQLLPLGKQIKSIAVLGEEATAARLGGYSGTGNNVVNILEGIKQMAGNTMEVKYAKGASRNGDIFTTIPSTILYANAKCTSHGLKGEYFKNVSASGTPANVRTDAQIDFHWTLYGPDNLGINQQYSVVWTGYLKALATGNFNIGLEGNDGFKMYVNDVLVIDRQHKQSFHREIAATPLQAGKLYKIKIEFAEPTGNAHIKLIWNEGKPDLRANEIAKAVNTAKACDVAIIVAGITEGEFQDRAFLNLPGQQEALVEAVAATGKPVVVLLVGGSAITMNKWINKVQSIVQLWYPGEAGGEAVANMLLGNTTPGGKLPITFPIFEGQLPLVYNHKPTGRGDDYNNLSGLPLFPFGYGLSYTSFSYNDIKLSTTTIGQNEPLEVSCTITNSGKYMGDEVVQLYLHDQLATVSQPVMELKSFQRISLKPGESKTVRFQLLPEAFYMYNEQMKYLAEPGKFDIMLGSSSRDIRLSAVVELK